MLSTQRGVNPRRRVLLLLLSARGDGDHRCCGGSGCWLAADFGAAEWWMVARHTAPLRVTALAIPRRPFRNLILAALALFDGPIRIAASCLHKCRAVWQPALELGGGFEERSVLLLEAAQSQHQHLSTVLIGSGRRRQHQDGGVEQHRQYIFYLQMYESIEASALCKTLRGMPGGVKCVARSGCMRTPRVFPSNVLLRAIGRDGAAADGA